MTTRGDAYRSLPATAEVALRGAIDKITEEAPAIGAHLDRSVRTGTHCSYRPTEAARLRVVQ